MKATIEVPDGKFGKVGDAYVFPLRALGYVRADCYQGGEIVFRQYARVVIANEGWVSLGFGPSELWTGGDADGVAEYGHFGKGGRWKRWARATFKVSG